MKRYLVHFIVLVLVFVSCTGLAIAQKFRYPGQELLGTWRIVRYDLSEFKQPVPQEVLDGLFDISFLLPPGQLIEVTFNGIYAQPPAKTSRPWLNFKIISPISDQICQFGIWKRSICENGKVPDEFTLEGDYGIWVVQHELEKDLSNSIALNVERKRLVQWPDALPGEYFLGSSGRSFGEMNIRVMKNNQLLVMFIGGKKFRGAHQTEEANKNKEIGTAYAVWERVPSKPDKK